MARCVQKGTSRLAARGKFAETQAGGNRLLPTANPQFAMLVGQAFSLADFCHRPLGEETWRSAFLTGAAERNAVAGFGLRLHCRMLEHPGESQLRIRPQRCLGIRRESARGWEARASGSPYLHYCTGWRLLRIRHIRHGAMMLPIPAAARRQARIGVHKYGGTDQREAEKPNQHRGRETPHGFILLRFRQIPQAESCARQ